MLIVSFVHVSRLSQNEGLHLSVSHPEAVYMYVYTWSALTTPAQNSNSDLASIDVIILQISFMRFIQMVALVVVDVKLAIYNWGKE